VAVARAIQITYAQIEGRTLPEKQADCAAIHRAICSDGDIFVNAR
jgi:hypothetical protein